MQDAKDTFFEAMRERLAAVNPDRTVVLRGAVPQAIVVDENELVCGQVLLDCFHLRWPGTERASDGAWPRVVLACEVAYETAGTALFAGADRGRVLGAMDAELAAMVEAGPQRAAKQNFGPLRVRKPAKAMTTNVWWGPVTFGAAWAKGERVGRVATVAVMAFEEAGEL